MRHKLIKIYLCQWTIISANISHYIRNLRHMNSSITRWNPLTLDYRRWSTPRLRCGRHTDTVSPGHTFRKISKLKDLCLCPCTLAQRQFLLSMTQPTSGWSLPPGPEFATLTWTALCLQFIELIIWSPTETFPLQRLFPVSALALCLCLQHSSLNSAVSLNFSQHCL
jgi:hypothetical protein